VVLLIPLSAAVPELMTRGDVHRQDDIIDFAIELPRRQHCQEGFNPASKSAFVHSVLLPGQAIRNTFCGGTFRCSQK
jgi:hypothetical protein